MAFANPGGRSPDQGIVLQQHLVHIEQSPQLGRGIGWQIALEHIEFSCHGVTGGVHARHLVIDPGRVDENVRHIDPAGCHQHGPTNRHPTRYRQTENLDAHISDRISAVCPVSARHATVMRNSRRRHP